MGNVSEVTIVCGIVFGTIFVVFTIIFFTCLIRYARRIRKPIYPAPVVVTSATHTAPGGYPTGMQSVSVYPTGTGYSTATGYSTGTGYQQNVYPQQTPYPVSGSVMPMPMPQTQMQPNPIGMNAMPPYPTTGPGMNPPSYESAVGTNPNPNQPGYEKQAPYNPSYATGY